MMDEPRYGIEDVVSIKVEKTERGALIYVIPRNNHVIKHYDTSGGTWVLWARDKKYLK